MGMKKYIIGAMIYSCCSFFAQGQTPVNTVSSLLSAITTATEGEVIQLSASFPTELNATINVTINHTNSFTIDGNGKTLKINGDFRHFLISKTTTAGSFTLQNLELKGLRNDTDGLNGGTAGGGVTIATASKGVFRFDRISFNSIRKGALAFSGLDANAIVRVTNSTFRNNHKGDHGGGIYYRGTGNLEVSDCTFDENYNSGVGYAGGAIVCHNYKGQLSVKRSVFLNNVSGNWGGAIGIYGPNAGSTASIDSCYFERNRVFANSGTADGGAVSIYANDNQGIKFELRNSTFYKNYASDDGGALFIQNYDSGAENYVTNCTMYENYANDANPAKAGTLNVATCGGAIQLSLRSPVTFEHNTIIQNYTTSPFQRGGGIGFHASTNGAPKVTLLNNIILGNYILSGGTKIYNNDANIGFKALLNPTTPVNSGNIGFDNGTSLPTDITLQNVFGNNDPIKWDNYGYKKIGNPYETNPAYYRISPTIPIKPNDGTRLFGLADRKGVASSLDMDERGYLRDLSNPAIGAVDIRWAKFDANGGRWNSLPNLTYDGTVYYEKESDGTVENYYQVTYHNGKVAPTHPQPGRTGYMFQYWALDSINGAAWDGTPLTITSNRTLYAIWRSGFFTFDNDTICEDDKADLTNLPLIAGSIVQASYYMDKDCRIPVPDPMSVSGGTYYIIGIDASNRVDTISVDIVENKLVKILLQQEKDTCLYYNRIDSLMLEIIDSSGIIIPGTEEWILDKKIIDPHTYILSSKDKGKKLYYQVDTKCGIARSNSIEIAICYPDVWILRPVFLPPVTGLETSLEPGEHFVKGHDDFVFTITPLEGYSLDGVTVKTNNPIWDDQGGVVLIRLSEDTMKVIIRQITEPIILTIEGVTKVDNAAIATDASVRTIDKHLILDVRRAMPLSVYTISGSLYTQRSLCEGKTSIQLPAGIYIVVLDQQFHFKAIIK